VVAARGARGEYGGQDQDGAESKQMCFQNHGSRKSSAENYASEHNKLTI
jgi:hypothetical protein